MRYFDTSFLVPLIFREETGDHAAEILNSLQDTDLTVSYWTRVEFSSMLARRVRMGTLEEIGAHKASARFEAMIWDSFVILLPDHNDFNLATELLEKFETSLRAGDALHLAIAANRNADIIYSLDKKMISAGKMLGLPTTSGVLPGYDH